MAQKKRGKVDVKRDPHGMRVGPKAEKGTLVVAKIGGRKRKARIETTGKDAHNDAYLESDDFTWRVV